jgi:hypothetical protein
MKKQISNHSLFSMVLLSMALSIIILFSPSCKKDPDGKGDGLPTITNTDIIEVYKDTVSISANIASDGGNAITEKGFVYSTTNNPTISDSVFKSATAALGNFSEVLTGFTTNTKYYARAYAINSKGTAYGEEVNFFIEAVKVGSRFGGGIVFYVDGTGKHGLIASRNGLGYTGKWGCEGVSIPGTISGTKTEIGTGQANTTLIANSCSEAGIAARFCLDLVQNGYDDWFLPSKDELKMMYDTRSTNVFSSETRWSSSQNDNNTAWAQKFDASGAQISSTKNSILGARAVRAF